MTHKGTITLQTKRLCIRTWNLADAADLYEICKSPDITNVGWDVHHTIAESKRAVRIWIKYGAMWAIEETSSKKVVGAIGLTDVDRHAGYRELEYAIAPAYRCMGYATEAAKRILTYGFDECGLVVIAAPIKPWNLQSKRVLEKCGFVYEGTLRRYGRDLADSVRLHC